MENYKENFKSSWKTFGLANLTFAVVMLISQYFFTNFYNYANWGISYAVVVGFPGALMLWHFVLYLTYSVSFAHSRGNKDAWYKKDK